MARRGRHELTNLVMTTAQVTELVEASARRLDVSTPFVDAILPEGHHLHLVLKGISRGFSAVKIRNFAHNAPTYLWRRDGWERQSAEDFLRVTMRSW